MGQGDPGRQHQGGVISAGISRPDTRTGVECAATHWRRLFAPTKNRDSIAPEQTVDRISGDWLANEVREIGLEPAREEFSLSRVDPVTASLAVNDRTIEGLPLFDGTFTSAAGIAGSLGSLNSEASIGLAEIPPNAAATDALGDARRQNRHQAIVVVTRGSRPGLRSEQCRQLSASLRPSGAAGCQRRGTASLPIARDRARRPC